MNLPKEFFDVRFKQAERSTVLLQQFPINSATESEVAV